MNKVVTQALKIVPNKTYFDLTLSPDGGILGLYPELQYSFVNIFSAPLSLVSLTLQGPFNLSRNLALS